MGNSALKLLYLKNNRLSSIPDLYHLPLRRLSVTENPMVCNQSLCWIRMWPWVKTSYMNADDMKCETPPVLQGVLLSDINPVTLGCHNGTYYQQEVTE